MLTSERMKEISELVEGYDEEQRAKEEYPFDRSIVEHLWNNHPEHDVPLVDTAAKEMGISVDELRAWFTQVNKDS